MDYEKKYNEALERAKELLLGIEHSNTIRSYFEHIFPELRENERIRKGLIKLLTVASEAYLVESTGIKKDSYLAWLEKQKEPKQTDLPAGFYFIDLDGNKYYSKEFRYGDMKLKVVEQKPDWSEEDKRILKGIIGKIDHDQTYGVSKAEMLNFLKKL